MKLFLISQDQNNEYDTFDSAVVAAETENEARNMDPRDGESMDDERWKESYSAWCSAPEHVRVKFIGEASSEVKQGVVCASFRAG